MRPDSRVLTGPGDKRIVRDHLAGRIPLIAAGQIRTPEQAERAIAAGLSLVAIGQGLVMNPDWASFALGEDQGAIALDIAASDVARLGIPPKLWSVIEATTGRGNIAAIRLLRRHEES